MKKSFQRVRGFTLVEIIVVVAVIGLLSMVVFASFDDSRKKGRDTARTADIQQLAAALQIYAATFGRYPTELGDLVTAGLYVSIPVDPVNEGEHVYQYENACASPAVSNDTRHYRLWTMGEREQGADAAGWSDSKTIGATSCADPQ